MGDATHPRGFFRQTYQVSELEGHRDRPVRLQQGNHSRPWVVDDPILSAADRANSRLRDLVPNHPRWSEAPNR